ncbi:SCO family protein [Luteimonas sp. 50]|uniref:SCO family protein n=1 Tax=Cognatiluteimonas sedimenti TaxID=2927791 RepID=A0ABT0A130_9GAMM|nr:SCO family protein [Lysobacter sedimenti]MCJ0824682.1 SCO family protein [Lysobacter sedimenti]
MKPVTFLASLLLAVAGSLAAAPAKAPPLPADSVYQLPLRLTDQHGKTWDWGRKRGQPQLVSMFYSSCQYICPLIVESGKAVERALTPAQRARLGVMLISMDPARDTPDTLARTVRQRHIDDKRWSLASPRADAVRSVAGVLDVRYRQLSDGEFNHTSVLILLDADGRILARTEKIGSDIDPAFVAKVKAAL